MSKKKKTRRDKEKYPDLNEKTSLKLRRDYIDNRHYVKGVLHNGVLVIPELDEKSKKFLNQFNREYYGASFREKDEKDRIHVSKIDLDTVADIKDQIRKIKAKRKKIFDMSANSTTEADREKARFYTEQIENMEDFLNKVYPKRDSEHRNNQRNRCFLNRNKASNEVNLVSWESLNEDSLVFEDIEVLYRYILDGEDGKDG
jgi:hypothetical protein